MNADLTARLLEAIDETERVARDAAPGPWRVEGYYEVANEFTLSNGDLAVVSEGDCGGGVYNEETAQHIVRHDPTSVLRRCASDRRMVKLWQVVHEASNSSLDMRAVMDQVMRHLIEAHGVNPEEKQ